MLISIETFEQLIELKEGTVLRKFGKDEYGQKIYLERRIVSNGVIEGRLILVALSETDTLVDQTNINPERHVDGIVCAGKPVQTTPYSKFYKEIIGEGNWLIRNK